MDKARLRIYIAGPYSATTQAEVERNVWNAIDAGLALLDKGHTPFVPHLTHFVELRAKEIGSGRPWEDYIRWDMEWLQACDAFLYLGSSPGADLELEAAKAAGMRIFYSVEEVPFAARMETKTRLR